MKRFAFASVVAVCLALLFSCNDISDYESHATESSGKARVSLSCVTASRTIMPSNMGYDDISKVSLSAKKFNGANAYVDYDLNKADASSEEIIWLPSGTGDTAKTAYQNMTSDTLELNYGSYIFTLNLYTDYTETDSDGNSTTKSRITQTGMLGSVDWELACTIDANTKSLSFKTEYVEYGRLPLKIQWDLSENDSESSPVGKVGINLYKITSGAKIGDALFEETLCDSSKKGSLCEVIYDPGEIPNGTYYIVYKLHSAVDDSKVINTITDIVTIKGYKSEKTITLKLADLNVLYTVTYDLNGGAWLDSTTDAKQDSRNKYSSLILPENSAVIKEGSMLLGWAIKKSDDTFETDETGKNLIIKEISSGEESARNYDLVAQWKENQFSLYVSGTGDDTDGDGTEGNPFETIDKACEAIIANADPDFEWTVFVSGSITGTQQIIPETLTTDMAKSVLITGATGVDDDGVPQDALDRGVNATTNGTTNGNVLVVSTAVPVTITNLKITRGAAADGSAIKICEGATVKLGDGVLITKNHYQSNSRGTVHNEGTLFMYGSAVIGDKTVQEFAYGGSSPSNIEDGTNANYVTTGGGIFNGVYSSTTTVVAHLYLGYSGFEEDGVTLIKKELTGGIYKNGASSGGAIYNSYNSYAYIDSGNFEWNSVSGCGGAIYNEEGAYLEMTGGSILNNRAYEGGNYTGYGGGIYNNGANSVFVMAGGTINKNLTQNDSGYGGGLYNKGKFFMYGTAVIGDETVKTSATATTWGNKSQKGGGIYNTDTGFVYLGYKPDSSRNPVEEELKGGIYGNYATGTSDGVGGGAINNYGGNSGGIFKIASGTIAYNASGKNGGAIWHRQANYSTPEILGGTIENNVAEENGGAIYIDSSNKNTLTFYDSAFILRDADGKHDIYLDTGSKTYYPKITIAGKLREDFDVRVTPGFYDPSMTILLLADDADTTLDAEHLKFSVTDETNEDLGTRTEWYINSSGTLTSQTPLGTLTMTIEHSTYSDISVSARYYESGTTTYSSSTGTKWYESNGLVTGKILVFTVTPPSGVELNSYTWYVDGETNTETGDSLVLDTANWTVGVYDLALETTDTNGTNYSYEAHISVKAQ